MAQDQPKLAVVGLVDVRDEFPPEFFSALGRLVVAFGRVEYLVKLTVKTLSVSGFTKGMTVAESESSFRRLCNKGEKSAKEKLHSEQFEAYCDLLECAKKLAIERNDNIHCLWTTCQGAPVRYRPFYNKSTKTLEWRNRMMSPADLAYLAAEMEELAWAIDSERRNWAFPA